MEQDIRKHEVSGDHPFSLYQLMWSKSFDFENKSNKTEFIWAMFVHFVIFAILITFSHIEMTIGITEYGIIGSSIFVVYFIFSYVPTISLMRRRLRDAGRSGANLWLLLIPFAGWIALTVLLFSNSSNID
ncbi:MAG: DUF805 domain-containing protein [Tenericutes bacterium]|nr:DUF805 domain-containing protein [Mycoplasmatota bacterium]